MNSEHTPETKIIRPGEMVAVSRNLRFALSLLKVPGFRNIASLMTLRHLPRCDGVKMEPGFRMLYGNISAKNTSFSDAFLQDYAEITFGEGGGFAYQCMVLTATHDIDNDFRIIIAKPVTIGSNVWIASRAIILGGAKIGDGSVIGAGSVVTGEIPAGVFAAGVPARPIREIGDTAESKIDK